MSHCRCFAGRQLLPRLLHASVTYLKPLDLDLPIGLISRLVLADTVFVEQFSHCVDDLKVRYVCYGSYIAVWTDDKLRFEIKQNVNSFIIL